MTTLILDRGPTPMRTANVDVHSTRDWLRGRWALLFSDPDDFTRLDFEADRWLILLREAFAAAEVRAAAVVSRSGRFARRALPCWLTQAGGECVGLLLREAQPEARVADLRASALYQAILDNPSRFVMILDSQLGLRRTINYSCRNGPPALFDLITAAAKIRMASSAAATHWNGQGHSQGNGQATSGRGIDVRRVRNIFSRPAPGARSCAH